LTTLRIGRSFIPNTPLVRCLGGREHVVSSPDRKRAPGVARFTGEKNYIVNFAVNSIEIVLGKVHGIVIA